MTNLKVYLSESTNPHLNLATEEWIFNSVDPSSQILFLWRNEETVVIGRNQNPWSECNLAKMKTDKIHLARRTTGGGAVFHDLGNTNFTFLSPKEGYRRENNVEIILDSLRYFGIQGQASGRNDLLIPYEDGPRKFSGSAYREKKDRAFHHGTLLIRTDLGRLGQYLTPNPKKLQAKGKESVRARVANLTELVNDLSHDVLAKKIVETFEKFYEATAEVEFLSMSTLHKNVDLKRQYEELSSWDWLYGRTLDFNQQIQDYLGLGFFDFHFQIENGLIKDLQIFSDCLYPNLIDQASAVLLGRAYTRDETAKAIRSLKLEYPHIESEVEELAVWLGSQVEA